MPTRRRTGCAWACVTCGASPTRSSTASTTSAHLHGPFADTGGLHPAHRRAVDTLEALATGAFGSIDVDRRDAVWAAGALRVPRPHQHRGVESATLPGVVTGIEAPALPGMTEVEETAADLWATGLSANRHPTEFVRAELEARGVVTADALRTLPDRSVVEVGGVVTHRQQPRRPVASSSSTWRTRPAS